MISSYGVSSISTATCHTSSSNSSFILISSSNSTTSSSFDTQNNLNIVF
ncbi:hypothetical protein HOF65_00430 [bacterium]|nr:hypothetical protein [bacterium]MBT3852515.1 hypothetical protein [bacterium]MBT4632680.1 hypothetical protein [bacterium]MBT6778299.1 hypothetical protein [bacterium]